MTKKQFLTELRALDFTQSVNDLYIQISKLAMKYLSNSSNRSQNEKFAYYLSMEFLTGNMYFNNLLAMNVLEDLKEILKENGRDIIEFEKICDPALGNGGLGRLAACFIDSASDLKLNLNGYGIRYKFGLFKQSFENGFQVESPDNWLKYGDPWSVRRESEKRIVHYADYDVEAVPYDYPIIHNEKYYNILRLWQAEGSEEAEKISEYLYPNDSDDYGKLLRIRQEYFFSSASIQELLEKFKKEHGTDFTQFSKYNQIQLNDTHPVFAIPELIRLLQNEGLSFIQALNICKTTFNYTNHTILQEALEKWYKGYIERILPEIYEIMIKLDQYQQEEYNRIPYDIFQQVRIFNGETFSMANLACYVAKKINGVAKIHSNILKKDLFKYQYKIQPSKFTNVTNGITFRRWIHLANPRLYKFITDKVGQGWLHNLSQLQKLAHNVSDFELETLQGIKDHDKRKLISYISKREHVKLNPETLVYTQIKRLHEYKRQLMTILAILHLYFEIKEKGLKINNSLFIFGGKAAPGYYRAKGVIKFINEVAKLINNDPEIGDMLKVIFVTNYDVSYAEKIIQGTDISLQVSTAGYEASGTGNMKFMLNGAITCGTLDGANIEIVDLVTKENAYIFGADELEVIESRGKYNPWQVLNEYPLIKKCVDSLVDGTFDDNNTGHFKDLYDSLTGQDFYLCLYDLNSYLEALKNANKDFNENKKDFYKKAIINIAKSGYFSSNRSIKEYAKKIWELV